MGNRAVLAIKGNKVDIYLHWNGGRASVEGFCAACKELGFRPPSQDEHFSAGYLIAACGLFFGDGLSVGVGPSGAFAEEGNGKYVIGGDWEVLSGSIREVDPVKTEAIKNRIVRMWKAAQAASKE